MTKNEKQKENQETTKIGPAKKFRIGNLTATIWKGKKDNTKDYQVVFEKSYKSKEGEWKTTQHYNNHDLPLLAKLVELSFEYIQDKGE